MQAMEIPSLKTTGLIPQGDIPYIYYCDHGIIRNFCNECRFSNSFICEHLYERRECLLCTDWDCVASNTIVSKYKTPDVSEDESLDVSISENETSSDSSEDQVLWVNPVKYIPSKRFVKSGSSKRIIGIKKTTNNRIKPQPIKRRYGKMCHHERMQSLCKECKKQGEGGGCICEHLKKRSICFKCFKNGTGGGSLCEHLLIRSHCKYCKILEEGGGSICEHENIRSSCKYCKDFGIGGGSFCDNDVL